MFKFLTNISALFLFFVYIYQALFSLYSGLAKHALSANIGAVYINFVFLQFATVYDVWSMK